MTEPTQRRRSDLPEHTDEEILELIQRASDEHQKAQLLVLYQLNRNMIHNTNVTVEISQRQKVDEANLAAHRVAFDEHVRNFDNHVIEERELFAKGMGAWKAYASVGMVVLILGGYILNSHLDRLTKESARNDDQEQRISRLERDTPISREAAQRLSVLESQSTNMMGLIIDLQHRYDDRERVHARELLEKKTKGQ